MKFSLDRLLASAILYSQGLSKVEQESHSLFQFSFTLDLITILKDSNILHVQSHIIILPTKGIEVTNKLLFAKMQQYLGSFEEIQCPAGREQKFKTLKCLKIIFKGNKTTQANCKFSKILLGLKICEELKSSNSYGPGM